MQNKYKAQTLIGLHISYLFQKLTLIIFGAAIISMIIILIILSNPWLSNTDYLLSSSDIHRGYFEQGIFVIQIFNSIIIATIVIQLFINSSSFDALFLSYIPRYKLCVIKLLSLVIILSLLILFEVLILYLIPILRYSQYKPSFSDLMILLYLPISIIFEILISVLLTTIIPSIFIPMVVLFLSVISKAISSIEKLKEILSYVIPLVRIKDNSAYLEMHTIIISLILSLIFSLLYIRIYQLKDIRW